MSVVAADAASTNGGECIQALGSCNITKSGGVADGPYVASIVCTDDTGSGALIGASAKISVTVMYGEKGRGDTKRYGKYLYTSVWDAVEGSSKL